jgi:cold shock CspA family protein
MRYLGKVTTWNDRRGVGYITPRGGGLPVRFSMDCLDASVEPHVGDEVRYELVHDIPGAPEARAVSFARNPGVSTAPVAAPVTRRQQRQAQLRPRRSGGMLRFAAIALVGVAGYAWYSTQVSGPAHASVHKTHLTQNECVASGDCPRS